MTNGDSVILSYRITTGDGCFFGGSDGGCMVGRNGWVMIVMIVVGDRNCCFDGT